MCTCETRKSPRSSRKISNILESNCFSNYLCHFRFCSFIFNFNICLVMWQLKCICFNSFHIYGQEISFYCIVSWCACTNNFWAAFHNTQTSSLFKVNFSIWQCRVASRIYCLLFRCYCLKLDSSVTFFVVFFYIFYFFRVSVCGMFKYTMNAWTDVVSQLRLFVIAFALIFCHYFCCCFTGLRYKIEAKYKYKFALEF